MKKLLYFLLTVSLCHTASAIERSWTGTTSNDWATPTNWLPNGVPTDEDLIFLREPTTQPIISSGTNAHVMHIDMEEGATLTINSGATLTVTNLSSGTRTVGLNIIGSSLINYGTITVKKPSSPKLTFGILIQNSTLTNWGTIHTDGTSTGLAFSSINVVTNHSTGIINANGDIAASFEAEEVGAATSISNSGILNFTGSTPSSWGLYLYAGTLSNTGTINFVKGFGFSFEENVTVNNLRCGKIIFENANSNDLRNGGTVNNSGLIQVHWWVHNSGSITNNGVLKYETLSTTGGTLTNNGVIIDDKTDPIVQVGASSTLSIQGIYTNTSATASAGTFTAPNQFSPSGLSQGDHLLYAKITPVGNACEYIVPFTYSMAAPQNRTWVGTTSIDWATPSNWSPSGVPTDGDILTIASTTNAPTIINGTSARAKRIFMQSGATLTINSGAALSVTNEPSGGVLGGLYIIGSTLINNGTLTVDKPNSTVKSVGIVMQTSTLTNRGTIHTNGADRGIYLSYINFITNHAGGVMNVNGDLGGAFEDPVVQTTTSLANSGVLNFSSSSGNGLNLHHGYLLNAGTINFLLSHGLVIGENATLNNSSCARIIFADSENNVLTNNGTLSNIGLIQTNRLFNNSSLTTNSGILKYTSLIGTAPTNNDIIIVDKTDPSVQVAPTNSFSILGIYTDEATTTSAGTFTTPNQFTPSGLSPGDHTLYAKITPGDNACQYIVPFVYSMTALPVILVQFSGKSDGSGQNTLTWLTSDEKNFAYFEIQRSSDARSFEAIGSVAASEQGNALKSYQFIDRQTAGMNYYRLKMVDQDGSYQLSKIISVLNSVENSVVGSFYPNPSSGQVFVDVYAEDTESWQIRVFDTSGKMIATESRILQKGMNKIALTTLVKGMNIVKFENKKSSISRKLVRQ